MSKCHVNWARTPNSRMDRQHRPKSFFREKNRVEDFSRLEKLEEKQEYPDGLEHALEKAMAEEQLRRDAEKLGVSPEMLRALAESFGERENDGA